MNKDVLFGFACPHCGEFIEDDDPWIPVSERLPEVLTEVLVSDEADLVYEALYDAIWLYGDGDKVKRKVLAWMPLPKPHKP